MTLLVFWSIAWLVGIWLGSLLAIPLYAWAGVVPIASLAAGLIRSPKARLLLGCAAALALGATRLTMAQPHFDERSLATYNDRGVATLVGVVAAEPDVRDTYVYYKLDAKSLALEDTEGEPLTVHGAARLRGPRYPVYAYGDRLQVRGGLETPPVWEDFSYRDYLARKNIHSYIPRAQVEWLASGDGSAWKRAMLDFKGRAQATVARIIPEPEASLLTGILLGVESGIPADTMEAFSATGTTHVIAISGFNITIITALLMATLGRIVPDRRLATGIAIAGVVTYTILVGADAAVVRAAVMGVVTIVGLTVGRPGLALNSLAFAAILMTALNPHTLWDVGFQLSAAATLGLILYSELFGETVQRLLARKLSTARATQVVGWISDALLLTVAAQITTTPLILKYFGRLSVVTLLTNVLILPVQPLVMFFGGTATLVGLIVEPLGRVVGWGAYLWLTWTIRVVEWTARLPHASVPLELSDLGLVVVYVVIGGLTALVLLTPQRRRTLWGNVRTRLPLKAALGGMTLVTAVAWFAIRQFPDGVLHVTFLDVGQGDAIFVETPGGVQILIDGGPEGSALLSELGCHMPFWDRTLNLVVLTHPDADHLSGLIPALERYGVRAVVARALPHETDLVAAWEKALANEENGGATLVRGEAGARLTLSDGVTLEILHPGAELIEGSDADSNNNSVVLRLTYGDVAFLLPGDVEAEVEGELVRSGAYLRSTVLKVPHHGSKTSSSLPFLDAVRPQVAVISVGQGNKFGHPSEEVLERLEGTLVFRTDHNGTVSIASDGHRLWVDAER
jgi:competence protein ComEC